MHTKSLLVSSVAGLMTLGFTGAAAAAEHEKAKEKCYGVAKAGHNDCAARGHSCQGQSKTDRDGKEWIYLPKGTCERIAGGSLSPK